MMRSLMIAKTGLEAQQTNMDVISNNIANVSTMGFKRQQAVFEDLLYQTVRKPGTKSSEQTTIPSGLQLGTGVRPVATTRIHLQGGLTNTGNPTDVAIEGSGFLQVLMPDGTNAYTRDGSLQRDQYGQLVTSSGYPIQPAVTIPNGASNLTISKDGLVSVTLPGQTEPQEVGQLTLATFINDAGLQSLGENLYYETPSSGAPMENKPGMNGAGALKQQFLENSNVNVAQELITMIQAQRAYELNSKAISTSDQMLQRLAQL